MRLSACVCVCVSRCVCACTCMGSCAGTKFVMVSLSKHLPSESVDRACCISECIVCVCMCVCFCVPVYPWGCVCVMSFVRENMCLCSRSSLLSPPPLLNSALAWSCMLTEAMAASLLRSSPMAHFHELLRSMLLTSVTVSMERLSFQFHNCHSVSRVRLC